MKRVLMIGIVALLIMMPLASFARTVISDNELSDVTAETGVSIVFTNVIVGNTTTLTSMAWGDADGFGTTYNSWGWMGINNVTITGTIASLSGTMNIDVGSSGTLTRMNIDLPAMTLGTMSMNATMLLSTSAALSSGNVLGYIDLRGFSTQVSGSMQVYAH